MFCDLLENNKFFEIRKLTSVPFKTYDIHYSVVNWPEHVFIFVLYFLNLLLTWPKCNQQGIHRSYYWKLFYYCLILSEHFTSDQLLRNSQNSLNIRLLFKKKLEVGNKKSDESSYLRYLNRVAEVWTVSCL